MVCTLAKAMAMLQGGVRVLFCGSHSVPMECTLARAMAMLRGGLPIPHLMSLFTSSS